mmetsp:Transcript_16898/g.43194  ORF Transcript_16898/g.43194 Transcript_16898/m.43194 type:complete len:201 (-) Transcript_16898:68-670(-)
MQPLQPVQSDQVVGEPRRAAHAGCGTVYPVSRGLHQRALELHHLVGQQLVQGHLGVQRVGPTDDQLKRGLAHLGALARRGEGAQPALEQQDVAAHRREVGRIVEHAQLRRGRVGHCERRTEAERRAWPRAAERRAQPGPRRAARADPPRLKPGSLHASSPAALCSRAAQALCLLFSRPLTSRGYLRPFSRCALMILAPDL